MAYLKALLQNDLLVFAVLTVLAWVLSQVFKLILNRYVHRIAASTETDLDDEIIRRTSHPLQAIVFLVIFYYALQVLHVEPGYEKWVRRVFFIVLAIIAATVVSRIAVLGVNHWLHVEKRFEKSPMLVGKIISVVIYTVAILMVLNYFDINITPLITALGIGGLAVGLALQGTLSNFFAGLHIITDRPFTVGDYIQVKEWDIAGYVEDIGWRTTRIRTLPNTFVIVPNNKIAESVLINNYMPDQQMSTIVQCGVAYESDLEKVERVTIEVARQIQKSLEGAVSEHQPFVRFHTFADSNINFSVILRVHKFVDRYPVTHAFIKAVKARYDEENIEIAWPIRKVYQAASDGSLKG